MIPLNTSVLEEAYECTLDEASLRVAETELHEDAAQRDGAIDTLRTWILQQEHFAFATDRRILLAFLRYSKFSQLKAREVVVNHVTAKLEHPQWFNDFNPFDPALIRLLKTGYLLPLPGYNEKGCKRLLMRGAAFDPVYWGKHKADFIRSMYTIFFHILRDERCQVNGLVYLCDQSDLTLAHQGFWRIDELKVLMKYWQNTVPTRFKAFHMYNGGAIFEALMAVIMPFFSTKLRKRFYLSGSNLQDLYPVFPPECLPVEYLPDDYTGPHAGSLDQMTDALLVDMQQEESVKYLATISHPDWKLDKSKKPMDVPNESFRKLNID